ncbi:hypothetical protein [Frondihabitans sp. PAMC 28766]|uniref:hypothetical protein n=1 Tax=Frondihabitans sp. PAMC 28766 TaxID=1795630 RepID=UPI0012FF833E|nr:hypothetical protein [Frondihabitans sp. PAMC 28766]
MPVSSPLDENLANALWLHTQFARRQLDAAVLAASEVDALIRQALTSNDDVHTIADASFVDGPLLEYVAQGGNTLAFFSSQLDKAAEEESDA